ncbi:S1C family serine protease [Luteipulveratus mongoliensis]|uniref:S1C family serine protease n=1 Tax=Luteipulveratus mongoliensis TaxID=571913 RepID=UPI000ABA160D|nr:trypsin-like peptidase domain-containing protein [Luteipulveratus mongoliensis]
MTQDDQQPQGSNPEHTQPIPPVPPAVPAPEGSPAAGAHPQQSPAQPVPAPPTPAEHAPVQQSQHTGPQPTSPQHTGPQPMAPQQGHPAAAHHGPPASTWGAPTSSHQPYGAQAPAYAQHASTTSTGRSGRAPWVAVPLAALLAAALASGGTYAATRDDNNGGSPSAAGPTTVVKANPADFADAGSVNWSATAAKVAPSVVSITLETNGGGGDQGSGVILDTAGNIITNNHVVADGGKLTVTLNDGRQYDATVVGKDPSTDLAVIKLTSPPKGLTPVTIGDDSKLVVGQPVMAVGNPLGLSGTVTTGIVSALNRPVSTQSSGGGQDQPQTPGQGQQNPQQDPQQPTQSDEVVTNAIQTSAAINPGNSGGALVDGSGRLVGINSSIPNAGSSGQDQAGNIGIGFAIPVTVVKNITGQLMKSGKAQHAQLGISATSAQVKDGAATLTGAKVSKVNPGSAAAKAGLKEGDTIVSIDGESVDSSTSLVGQVRERTVGQKVTLSVVRDGKRQNITATLGADSSSS